MTPHRSLLIGVAGAYLAVVALVALIGPWLSPHDPNAGQLMDALQGSSRDHWLGTDYLGRDVLSRIIAGSRVAMIAGAEATLVALVLGGTVGMVIGLAGGWVDRIVMRAIDGLSAIPAIVLAIAIIAALGSGLTRSMFAVGVAFAMSLARLARGLTLSERERLYVDGARVVGAGRRRLLVRHIAPNIAGPIAVQATLVFASAIAIEAALSFLGLGAQPPDASWGGMLSAAQRTVRQAPLQAIPPGIAIVLTVLAVNILGDALVRRRRGDSYANPSGYLEPVAIAARDAVVADGAGPDGAESDDAGSDGFRAARAETDPPGALPAELLLRADGVCVDYGSVRAVADVDLDIRRGEVVALVGESGSGKTSLAMAIAGLLTAPAQVRARAMTLAVGEHRHELVRHELVGATARQRRDWRSTVGVVFQEPAASLNPLQTVGRQLRDVIAAQRARPGHRDNGREDGRARPGRDVNARVVELLTAVGLREPAEVARLRPSQISGGMAQRVMIALALAKEPALLVADEPTTALDVTVQAEIIGLLKRLCADREFAVLLVTHDLGVAGELADRCAVMFRGELVEIGPTRELARHPRHPYTSALVAAVPQNEPGRPILHPPPALGGEEADDPLEADVVTDSGCSYRTTCPHARPVCVTRPELVAVPVSSPAAHQPEAGSSAARQPRDRLAADDPASPTRWVKCHRQAELELPGARSAPRPGAEP